MTRSRVGLAHDYLLVLRGAERTFAAIADIWPQAPIHTLLFDDEGTHGRFHERDVRPSALQRLGVGQSQFRRLLPLYPTLVRSLDVGEHDVIVSSSSAFAHGVRPRWGAVHVCYCHSPFRYAWHERQRGLAEVPRLARPALDLATRRHRRFDRRAAASVTTLVANSEITRERIRRFWGRDAQVVHPPVEVDRFRVSEPEDYLLYVGELVAHKRVDVALEAARRAGRTLRVVGSGPEMQRLRERYGRSAEFVGRVDDATLAGLYARADAVVVPNVEEFGIAAVEAQAAGRPVVAADAGGARETVVHGRTGWLLPAGDVDALTRSLRRDVTSGLDAPEEIRRHAQRFSVAAFRQRMQRVVDEATAGVA
jgi:glycosyltransferase involved in cell wall biosynthesis